MGNLPKNSKWRTNGDPGIMGPGLEARPAVLGNRGKTGKNGRMTTATAVPPGWAACSLLPGKPSIR